MLTARRRMENAAYFIEKAAQCRRLADLIVNQDDPAVQALRVLAEEFEAKATAYVAREKAAQAIGLGDDVAPIKPPPEPSDKT